MANATAGWAVLPGRRRAAAGPCWAVGSPIAKPWLRPLAPPRTGSALNPVPVSADGVENVAAWCDPLPVAVVPVPEVVPDVVVAAAVKVVLTPASAWTTLAAYGLPRPV